MFNWMVDFVCGVLNFFLFDVYIFFDYVKGDEVGKLFGYGIFMVVEIIIGCFLSVEGVVFI